ncbi:uncharacterized protein [Apostichopus japonicus]|uniref:uncharacterized protein n=1 Tax=Stichopus japonicus TaxID=307972 RepID=UPI003AB4B272
MEGIQSSVVWFTLLLAIFGPTVSFGNTRTCFCETWRHPSGESSDGSSAIRLLDINNPVYSHWLHLSCSSPKTWCPRDCMQNALQTLGGSRSTFTEEAGNRVCSIYGHEKSYPGISVVAKYVVSNCGARGTHLLAEHVCCAPRCSCYLKAVRNSRTTTLRLSHRTHPSPYHVCNTEGIHSDCKNECINYFETVLRGSISRNYDVTSSTELCRMLGTTSPPGARVYIQYRTMGVTKTVDLPKMCCFRVPGIPTTFPNTDCVSIGV